MMLRLAIAEERGFRDELKMSVLAKIMLAERFAPELYDALARGSANTGASEHLAALDAVVAAAPSDMPPTTEAGEEKVPAPADSHPAWTKLERARKIGRKGKQGSE